jgi:hypothetical protein
MGRRRRRRLRSSSSMAAARARGDATCWFRTTTVVRRLDTSPEGWGTSSYFLDDNSWNVSGVWCRAAGLEVPTHERGVQSGGLEVPAHAWDVQRRKRWGPRALGCFGLSVLHVVGQSAWVQQHCGGGSCTTVTLSVRWCLLLCSSISAGSLQRCRYTQGCGLWVVVAVVFCLPCRRCE